MSEESVYVHSNRSTYTCPAGRIPVDSRPRLTSPNARFALIRSSLIRHAEELWLAPRPRRHWALIHHGACATWQARRSQASPHDANGRCTIIRQCGATTQEEEEENRPVHRHHATDGGDSDPAMVFDCVLLHSGASSPHRLVVVAVHTVTLRAPGFVGRREGSASSRMCVRSWRCLVSSEPGSPCDRS